MRADSYVFQPLVFCDLYGVNTTSIADLRRRVAAQVADIDGFIRAHNDVHRSRVISSLFRILDQEITLNALLQGELIDSFAGREIRAFFRAAAKAAGAQIPDFDGVLAWIARAAKAAAHARALAHELKAAQRERARLQAALADALAQRAETGRALRELHRRLSGAQVQIERERLGFEIDYCEVREREQAIAGSEERERRANARLREKLARSAEAMERMGGAMREAKADAAAASGCDRQSAELERLGERVRHAEARLLARETDLAHAQQENARLQCENRALAEKSRTARDLQQREGGIEMDWQEVERKYVALIDAIQKDHEAHVRALHDKIARLEKVPGEAFA
jgi:hypothetical protein